MKSTLKNTFKILGCVAGAALLFSCTNPAAGTGAGGTVTGASGVTFSTVYTEPTLPANVGTDPFKGHTYRQSQSSSSSSISYSDQTDYEFGNNGELTYSYTFTSGSNTNKFGTKYSYTYNADTKEMNVKVTQILQKPSSTAEYKWFTYAECISWYVNLTTAQLNEMNGNGTTYTDAQAKEMIETQCRYVKSMFETITIYKAELDTSNNLKLRQTYYKTAPTLPNSMGHTVSYTSNQTSGSTTTSIQFNLSISPEYTTGSKGQLITSRSVTGSTPLSKMFLISNITSNTITAVESTSSSTRYTPVSGGITLQLGYTCSVGNDNNLVITVTGSDNTSKDYLRTLLGDNTLTNPSITATSSTYFSTYTLVQ